jgi:peptide-methionine (S)-S-oxide reductase
MLLIKNKLVRILALGGGCHWCTEAVFQQIPGVLSVKQGYLKSEQPYDSWSEGIIIEYNSTVSLKLLIDVHLQTHQSKINHSRRTDYRSAIYYNNQDDREELEVIMISLSRLPAGQAGKRNQQYITRIIPFSAFKPSRESIQDYYRTRPEAPFCKRYILPKLDKVTEILNAKNN